MSSDRRTFGRITDHLMLGSQTTSCWGVRPPHAGESDYLMLGSQTTSCWGVRPPHAGESLVPKTIETRAVYIVLCHNFLSCGIMPQDKKLWHKTMPQDKGIPCVSPDVYSIIKRGICVTTIPLLLSITSKWL